MSADSITLTVLAPAGTLAAGEVDCVIIPAEGGDMAIHPAHTSAVCHLRPGRLAVSGGGLPEEMALSGGYCEIVRTPSGAEESESRLHSTVVICARTAEIQDQIDVARAEESEKRARRRLAQPEPDIDPERARRSLLRALARLSIARGD